MSLIKLTNQKSKEVDVSSDIRICYFTVYTNRGTGYVCVALNRPEKDSNNKTYRAAFSSYSPQDEKNFSKVQARNAAVGRVVNWRNDRKHNDGQVSETNPRLEFEYVNYSEIPSFGVDGKFNLKDVFVRALNLAMFSRAVPGWVSKNSSMICYGLDPVIDHVDSYSQVVLNPGTREQLKKVLEAH